MGCYHFTSELKLKARPLQAALTSYPAYLEYEQNEREKTVELRVPGSLSQSHPLDELFSSSREQLVY